MNKKHLVAAVGTMALMANLLLPGLAFGQGSDPQSADVTLTCGTLTLTVDTNNDFRLALAAGTNPTVSTSAQDTFGKFTGAAFGTTYQNGTTILPNEAFIAVNDSRTVGGGAGCATNGTDEGWTLSAQAVNFTSGGNTIANSNFDVVTSTNVTADAGFTEFAGTGDGSDTNVFYSTGFAGTQDVTAIYNVADSVSLTTAATFTGQGASLNTARIILDNASGAGTNDFKFTSLGTALAYYLAIPPSQQGGTYTSTVTLTLASAT